MSCDLPSAFIWINIGNSNRTIEQIFFFPIVFLLFKQSILIFSICIFITNNLCEMKCGFGILYLVVIYQLYKQKIDWPKGRIKLITPRVNREPVGQYTTVCLLIGLGWVGLYKTRWNMTNNESKTRNNISLFGNEGGKPPTINSLWTRFIAAQLIMNLHPKTFSGTVFKNQNHSI